MKTFLQLSLLLFFISAKALASSPCIMGEVQLTTAADFTNEYIELKGQEFSLVNNMHIYSIISSRVEYNPDLQRFKLPTVSNVSFIADVKPNKKTAVKVGLCIKGEFPQLWDDDNPHECRPNKLYFFLTNEVPAGFVLLNQTPNFSNEFLTDNKTEILVARCRQVD